MLLGHVWLPAWQFKHILHSTGNTSEPLPGGTLMVRVAAAADRGASVDRLFMRGISYC